MMSTTRPFIRWPHGRPRCVFISGGGSGIGREFALHLAHEGASVAVFNRSSTDDLIAEMRACARDAGQRFAAYRADVADDAALQSAIDQAVRDLGRPDLAINSAGIQAAAPFDTLSATDFRRVIDTNLIGSRNFAAAVLPHLGPGAHLVFVASLAGLLGNYAYAAYCASKYGVVGLAEVLRIELKPRGIDVSVCCPGELPTPLVERERQTLHPVSAALKDVVGTLPLVPACNEMLRRMARRQFVIVPGAMPRLSAWNARHLPALMHLISDTVTRRVLARLRK